MKIRKQVSKLTLSDIQKYPIWEYATDEEGSDGQDETMVRPVHAVDSQDRSENMIVRADFILTDGTQMMGFIKMRANGALSVRRLQPVIIAKKGHVGFWHGALKPDREELKTYYSILERTPDKIFPIKVISAFTKMESFDIQILGFMYLEDLNSDGTSLI